MSRPIVLSNGSLHIGINYYAMVHDLYYPHVGLENHAAAQNMRHRIGVWTEGEFSWLDDGTWQFTMNYEPRALISHIAARNTRLGVSLEFTDCVDADYNVFLRNIHVLNGVDRTREIRLFLHQALLISNSLNKDTAQFMPDETAILHYKGRRSFVISGQDVSGKPFSQFSIGTFGTEGKEGAYRDAEDGVLSGNVVEHGNVDSVIGFSIKLRQFESTRVSYWLAAGKTPEDALEVHRFVRSAGIHARFERTANYWHRWLAPAERTISGLPKELHDPFRKSLLIIKSHIDHKGAVMASTDTTMLNYWRDAYAYCWPRDGAYALWPLLRLGYKAELKNFFGFCRDVLHPKGFLLQKYQPDGAPGATWHPYIAEGRIIPPIQEDETAIVIFMLGQYVEHYKDKKTLDEFYDTLVVPAANFMASYIDEKTKLPHATYDLWEEKFLTTTYTTALVHAALVAAATMAKRLKKHADVVRWQMAADEMHAAAQHLLYNKEKKFFYKGFINRGGKVGLEYDDTVDASSFYGAYMYGLFDAKSPKMLAAHETFARIFHIADDGVTPVPRYEDDKYNTVDLASLGNPWFVTTFWLAQYDNETGRSDRSRAAVDWAVERMLPSGILSEQLNPFNQKFISVAPLLWSQAEFLNTVLDITTHEGGHEPA